MSRVFEPDRPDPRATRLRYEVAAGGCWEVVSHAQGADGYPQLTRGGKRFYAMRWAYIAASGDSLSSDDVVMHECDNRLCINPEHLSVGSRGENSADRFDRSSARGVLKPAHVVAIREKAAQGVSSQDLAWEFGISARAVRDVVARRSYPDIQ